MILSKTVARRKVRDAKILELYEQNRKDGGKREAVAEYVAQQCECSVTTVKRITTNLETQLKEDESK